MPASRCLPATGPGSWATPSGHPGCWRARCAAGTCAPARLARLAAWAAPALGSVERLLAGEDSSLAESLDRAGVTGAVRRDIWDPFFAGVLAESDGSTSGQFARLLVRSFVLGRPAVPAAGMAALPGQISAALISPVHLSTEVTEVRRTRSGVVVASSAGSFAARAVVVAADPVTAGRLAGTRVPRMKGLATWWYATAETRRPCRCCSSPRAPPAARWSTARS